MKINRRNFLSGVGAVSGLGLLAGPWTQKLGAAPSPEPHFLIHLYYVSGVDASYLFDARDPALRTAQLAHSYVNEPPEIWEGSNGGRTLASSLVKPLAPYRDYFSVVNGVIMSSGNDGHEQNRNKLFTNSVSGGASYMMSVGATRNAPLHVLELGPDNANIDGGSRRVRLAVTGLQAVAQTAKRASRVGRPVDDFIRARAATIGEGLGLKASGARAIRETLIESATVAERFAAVEPPAQTSLFGQSLDYTLQLFRLGLVQTATLSGTLGFIFDTHDPTSCRNLVNTIPLLVGEIRQLIDTLRSTPYDATRSMADVTTWVVSTEFSRTLRQFYVPFENTGTDHNPLGNSILCGGKGIRGGLVLGGTDLDALDATGTGFAEVSPEHLRLDPYLVKAIGRPVDADTMLPLPVSTESSAPRLHVESLCNTMMANFGVDPASYFTIDRRDVAPVLQPLLS